MSLKRKFAQLIKGIFAISVISPLSLMSLGLPGIIRLPTSGYYRCGPKTLQEELNALDITPSDPSLIATFAKGVEELDGGNAKKAEEIFKGLVSKPLGKTAGLHMNLGVAQALASHPKKGLKETIVAEEKAKQLISTLRGDLLPAIRDNKQKMEHS